MKKYYLYAKDRETSLMIVEALNDSGVFNGVKTIKHKKQEIRNVYEIKNFEFIKFWSESAKKGFQGFNATLYSEDENGVVKKEEFPLV